MLLGNLCDYVGRPVMRKSGAARGRIVALMHVDACPVEPLGMGGGDDQVFEIVLHHKNNDTTHYISARSKVMDESDFRLL